MNRTRAAALAFVALVAACQPGRDFVASGPVTTGPTGNAITQAPLPSPSPNDLPSTVLDAALLDFLPDSLGGVPVVEAEQEAAIALADPTVRRIASAVDVGLAVDESTGNLVTAHIVRLREGAFDEATFRQWRDSFDEGACAGAGGVEGHAEVPIAERTVFLTSCVAEQRIYHLWLQDAGLLISSSSVGPGGFGEALMRELRIP